ncbi:MAG: peptidylprolyl isomerase [Candidatus Omnitrophica bacterium]|nr:peptidylprolyl isomerase [Candidatus Omnitrophota bacterium]
MNRGFVKFILAYVLFVIVPVNSGFCEIIDKIVVIVNDEVITQREVYRKMAPVYEQVSSIYGEDETGKRMEDAFKGLLEQLVNDKLIVSEAKRRGIRVPKEEVEAELDNIKERFKTEQEFYLVLDKQGISINELEDNYKNAIIAKKLIDLEIGPKIQVTPIEIIRYFKNHMDEFAVPEVAKVRSILIRVKDGRGSEEALTLTEDIILQLKSGDGFDEIAKVYSEDSRASSGGDMGYVKKGEMMKKIDDVLFALDIGEYSEVIRTDIGFHIFFVEDKRPPQNKTFDEVKSRIEEIIFNQKIQKKLKEYIEKLRAKAFIAYK